MDEILSRLERIEGRLDALEGRVVRPLPPIFPLPIAPPPMGGEDLERTPGTRWLPLPGARAVVVAIASLIGLGLQRGLITPAMVAVGIAVALVLLGLGVVLLAGGYAYVRANR